jgi:hypothetical protein
MNYSQKLDFLRSVSYQTESYLTYRFYERFKNLLILLSDQKSDGSLLSFLKVTETENLQYVLNFSKIELYKKGRAMHARLTMQLYYNDSKSIQINAQYEGNWRNPGFEFACEDKTIDCTVKNALSAAMRDVIKVVATSSPTLKKARELAKERYDELMKNHLTKPNDLDFLKHVIHPMDSSIVLKDQFQILIDTSQTKFLAFFLEEVGAQDFASLKDSKKDRNINIISGSDFNSPTFLEDVPQKYAYIVKGVKYLGKWYYEKANVTYFEATTLLEGQQEYFYNLAKWDFFQEGSAEFNLAFWESNIFRKVEPSAVRNQEAIAEINSLIAFATSEEDKLIYQDMLDDYAEDDLKNQEYFGLYVLVADEFKRDKEKELAKFSAYFDTDLLPKFYDAYCKENKISRFVKMNGKNLRVIFPQDRSVVLSPIVFEYEKDKFELHFFVLIPNEDATYSIYKWNYFEPVQAQYKSMYGGTVNEQLNKITKWNFSFNTLDDENFWNNFVLLKVDGAYKYLTKVNF